MGISDGVERGRESEAVDRVVAGRVRMIPRAHGTYDWHGYSFDCITREIPGGSHSYFYI